MPCSSCVGGTTGIGGAGGVSIGTGGVSGLGGTRGLGGATTGAGGVTSTGGVFRIGGAGGLSSGTAGTGGGTTFGKALRFDGIDDTVTLPAGADAANETAFSAELWFKTTTQTGMMFEVYTPGGGADRSLYFKDGQVCFYVWTPAYSEICSKPNSYNDGLWHQVAGTLGPGGQRLYMDGAMLFTTTKVTYSAFSTDRQFRLGYGYIGPYGPLIYFAGVIDEVRVWAVERSPKDIVDHYRGSVDPSTPGLQGYWKLDDSAAATTATDSTIALHHGVLSGFSFNPSPWVAPGAF